MTLDSCGLLDRVQSLLFANGPAALKMLLIGNVLVEGNAPTLTLDSFLTGENISSTSSVCPFQNRPMVSVLQNLQITLQVFLSGRFFGAIDPFILLLEGSERPLELVPAEFLRYSVESVIRKFFRVVRSETRIWRSRTRHNVLFTWKAFSRNWRRIEQGRTRNDLVLSFLVLLHHSK